MMSPRLSIVTPSYKQAAFIEETLDSVRELDRTLALEGGVEHVVVDGGSDNGTVSILEDYEFEYDLRWVSEPDDGQSHAINKGIEMAAGEFVGWINSDDYYLPGAADAFEAGLERNPDADVIYGDFVFVDVDGAELDRKYHTRPLRFVHKYWQNYTANHCTFVRRSVIEDVGDLREDLAYVMDVEFLWRLLEADVDMIHVQRFVAARRLHEDAKTVGDETDRNAAEKAELRKLYGTSRAERILPRTALTVAAIGLQATLFARERRWAAIKDLLAGLADR